LAAASTPQSLAYVSLDRVVAACSLDGWDGYGARAISQRTYKIARAFLDELPMWLPAPDIVPESDGDIAVEWDFGPHRVFSVSIGERGQMHFAGLFGNGVERHGVEPFDGVLPTEFVGYITRLVGTSGSRRAA
jgi:hypothetical protein